MLDIAARLLDRLDAGVPVVVATSIDVDGSAPRTVGASMSWDGAAVAGSIAGGCVEGAVVEVAERVLDDGRTRTVEFGVSDRTALGVGLACGGRLRIHLVRIVPGDPVATPALRDAAAGRSAAIALTPDGVDAAGCTVPGAYLDVAVVPARMILLGALEFSVALSAAAVAAGFAVTVCDPRELFATSARFPGAEVVVAWPPEWLAAEPLDARTVVALLGHDDRWELDALAVALGSPAGYVGAMGSRRTTARRLAALAERGVDATRLHAPIGLDLGASTPEEIAISVLAEVLAERAGATARPLREVAARPLRKAAEHHDIRSDEVVMQHADDGDSHARSRRARPSPDA